MDEGSHSYAVTPPSRTRLEVLRALSCARELGWSMMTRNCGRRAGAHGVRARPFLAVARCAQAASCDRAPEVAHSLYEMARELGARWPNGDGCHLRCRSRIMEASAKGRARSNSSAVKLTALRKFSQLPTLTPKPCSWRCQYYFTRKVAMTRLSTVRASFLVVSHDG